MVQWLRFFTSNAGGLLLIPGQGIVTVGQQLVQQRNEETRLNTQKKLLFDVIVKYYNQEFSSVQSLSHDQLFATL